MDSQGACDSIGKSGGSTIGEEFVQRPLHSDHGLNSISWLDCDHTAWGYVELEDINDAEESVLSTLLSTDFIILLSLVIVAIRLDEDIVSVNAEGPSVRIEDSQDERCVTVLRLQGEGLVLWSIASVFDVISVTSLGINNNRIS